MKKVNYCLTFLLTVLMSVVGAKASAHDIEVANADGVTIYYKWNSDTTELSVSYRASSVESSDDDYSGNVVIPSSVTYDGKEYSVTGIGVAAFRGCSDLTSVEIPNSVKSIGEYAFNFCSGLTSVEIPNSVTTIGLEAFYECSDLTSVTIPSSVTTIDVGAFESCSSLAKIVVASGNTAYDSRNDCNAIIETASNTLITGCQNTIIPNSVTSIGEYAFFECYDLTSVEIPNSVTTIGDYAFTSCSGLTSVEIPNSVTSIGNWAFWGCSSLTSVTIGSSVTTIDVRAFESCSSLAKIVVASGNTAYDSRNDCNAIIETASNTLITGCRNTIIPNSVKSIGEYAFFECYDLTSVEIPNSVTTIGDYAFEGCSGLTKIEVASGNTVYDSRNDCNAIIETASNTLIAGCQNTIIPNSVTNIGNYAFCGCSELTSMEIPNSVKNIGEDAFLHCSGLSSVTIPNSVTNISKGAFMYCTRLTSIEIPNSVTSIGGSAFWGCSSLTSVTIGSSVTSIGTYIFYDCKALTKLLCLATTPPVCAATFSGIDKKNCTLIVPAGSIADYKAANHWKDFHIIEEATTGINQTRLDNALPVRQYDASGSRIAAPQRGINIIRNSDGTTKKVLVK